MNRFYRILVASAFLVNMSATQASPIMLITHNTTDSESNAFIGGTIPSNHPTKPHSDNKVSWVSVKMACFGHTNGMLCPALIKMASNTADPIELGTVVVDLKTGDITPKQLHANGYTLIVNGPGETTLLKD